MPSRSEFTGVSTEPTALRLMASATADLQAAGAARLSVRDTATLDEIGDAMVAAYEKADPRSDFGVVPESLDCRVLSADGQLLGLVRTGSLIQAMQQRHQNDRHKLDDYHERLNLVRAASLRPLRKRFGQRMPWLLLGLMVAIVTADIVGWFETQLREHLVLAFFLPGVVYLADAVGTQTEAVIVRALSVDAHLGRMAWSESLTGLAVAVTLALVAFPLVLARWGNTRVAAVVAASVLLACACASLLAIGLSRWFDRRGADPAVATGPIATALQDLLTISMYFAVMTAVFAL